MSIIRCILWIIRRPTATLRASVGLWPGWTASLFFLICVYILELSLPDPILGYMGIYLILNDLDQFVRNPVGFR